MKKPVYIVLLFWALSFLSCKASISPDELQGTWKYIRVEHPAGGPTDTLTADELKANNPSIQFSKNNEYVINWGGKALSHGSFKVDGMNIQLTESLPDGTTRQFPFWVSSFSDNKMIFQNQGEDNSKVTAVKE